jgi:ribonuclease R
VKLVEAAPVAGALRFELLSEGKIEPRRKHTGRSGRKARVADFKTVKSRTPRGKRRR